VLDADSIETALWLKTLDRGHLVMPDDVEGYSGALVAAVRHRELVRVQRGGTDMRGDETRPARLTVWVNCCNGDTHIWRVCKALTASRSKITTIAQRLAISAGAWIALAGDVRYCTERTKYVIHGATFHENREAENEKRVKYLVERTGGHDAFWAEKLNGEKHEYKFGADEAIELGVAHEIIDEERMRELWVPVE